MNPVNGTKYLTTFLHFVFTKPYSFYSFYIIHLMVLQIILFKLNL